MSLAASSRIEVRALEILERRDVRIEEDAAGAECAQPRRHRLRDAAHADVAHGHAGELARRRAQGVDVEPALPQLGVGEGQQLQDRERQQHGVLGDADRGALGRQRERDPARLQLGVVGGVLPADALVVDEL